MATVTVACLWLKLTMTSLGAGELPTAGLSYCFFTFSFYECYLIDSHLDLSGVGEGSLQFHDHIWSVEAVLEWQHVLGWQVSNNQVEVCAETPASGV